MYKNLQEFLKALDQAGEIKYIEKEVSPYLEISKYTDRESKSPGGGKALFFKKVTGSPFPAATNIFGSQRRMCMALGVKHPDDPARRIREYIEFNPPKNLKEAINIIPMAINLTQFFPRTHKFGTPPCQEVLMTGDRIDLSRLPVLHCWPKDAGRFITLPLVITQSLVTGKRNTGMYRMQIFDKNTTGMHWHIHKDGSHYFNEYVKAGKRMPVSVAIGADPATTYAATAPLPRGVDEMLLAGFLRKKPVTLAKCVTNDLMVPAEAEFVLEGYVDPGELRREGPFGDHTGYYSLADDYPVFHVTAITHRRHPVYNATLVGPPPMEDCYMAKATERIFLPMLQTVLPEIRDYWLPWEGVFHNIVVVSIEKEYPGHAQKVMSALWGQGQMSFCKAIVIVDEHVDVQDPRAVFEAILQHLDIDSDLTITKGILDVLDHSAPHANFGHKIGLDLTPRFPGEPPRTNIEHRTSNIEHRTSNIERPTSNVHAYSMSDVQWIERLQNTVPGIIRGRLIVTARKTAANAILALGAEKTHERRGSYFMHGLSDLPDPPPFNIILLFDPEIDLSNDSLILWKLFNNVDPVRDMWIADGRVIIDACKKGPADGHEREWPDELTFDEGA